MYSSYKYDKRNLSQFIQPSGIASSRSYAARRVATAQSTCCPSVLQFHLKKPSSWILSIQMFIFPLRFKNCYVTKNHVLSVNIFVLQKSKRC